MLSVSVVIPIYNERDNIRRLYEAVVDVLDCSGRGFELILVNDGSTDGSDREIAKLSARDRRVKVVEFRGNFGQTAAMSAGIASAACDVVVTMDGDLQNDPADIPLLLEKIDEGYDLVHGWRKNRKDRLLSRRLPSVLANRLISKVTGFPVRDLGCTLKAMRLEVARELRLYGEMHRFIPILAHWRGARCAEVVVNHFPRRFGESKYGISRTFRVLFDLITIKYLTRHLVSPMKLFGAIGAACTLLGLASACATVWMKLNGQVDMTGNPLLLLSAVSTMIGVQFFGMGLLGELGARIYYEVESNRPYAIRRLVNFAPPEDDVLPFSRGTNAREHGELREPMHAA